MVGYVRYFVAVCMMITFVINFAYAVVQEEEPPAEKTEPAAAIVNDERIPMSRLDKEIQRVVMTNPELQSKENVAELRKMRREALDYLIDQELMFQEAKKADLKSKDAEVDAELIKIKQRFPSQEVFEQALKQQDLTEKKLREIISRAMIIRQMIEVKIEPTAEPVADEAVASFYEENKGGFVESEKVDARHILIKVAPDASDEEKDYAKKEMENILKEIRDGADFAELAKKNSQCPSAPKGGELGYFTRGQMVKSFEDAAFALQPGEVSDVVETRFGYHIILVQNKEPKKQLGLEEVAEQIKAALLVENVNIATEKWLEPIRQKATINILFKG